MAGLLRRILRRIEPRLRRQFWILMVCMIVAAGIETFSLGTIAFFASAISSPAEAVDSRPIVLLREVLPPRQADRLSTIEGIVTGLSVLIFLLIVFKNALGALLRYWITRFTATIQGYIGEVLLNRFLYATYEWHLRESPADLINAVQWRQYFGEFVHGLMVTFSDGLVVLVMVSALMIINPLITSSILVVLGGSSFLIIGGIKRVLDRESYQVQEYSRQSFRDSTMGIHAIKDVKIFGKERFFGDAFRESVYALARLVGKQRLYAHAPVLILEAAGFFMLSATTLGMLYLLKSSLTSVFATLALLAVTAWRILPALNRITGGITHLRTTLPFVSRVFEFIERTPQEAATAETPAPPELRFTREMTIHRVTFSYNGSKAPALDHCTCAIRKGQSIGIIGHSGAGKSTLVDIIIGLLKPQSGAILLDGRSMGAAEWRAWRSKVGYVPQSPYIYDGTIAENVAFGLSGARIDRERVEEACRMASMEFIDDLPLGIDTVIGERGILLSGGQRQRLAIARSLYNRPEVLIFDEATSSLDSRSEKMIQRTIYSFKGKQTLIIIAHRLSTVEDCDYLIWMERGRIVEIDEPRVILEKYNLHQLIRK